MAQYIVWGALADDICRCSSGSCRGLVKPSIVFFGEGLPYEFFQSQDEDFGACDLLLVMGTSLAVAPFNELVCCKGHQPLSGVTAE